MLEHIFKDRVYVYHNKVALKYPGVPGFKYHQDYFYWYHMGNLFPDMATAFIAVDRSTAENGALKVVRGSHRLGRIEHVGFDGLADSGVQPERLAHVLARLPEVTLALERGDVALFHCNTLHAADENRSNQSRIALLGCYNTAHNDPFKQTAHPGYVEQNSVEAPITEEDVGRFPDLGWTADSGRPVTRP